MRIALSRLVPALCLLAAAAAAQDPAAPEAEPKKPGDAPAREPSAAKQPSREPSAAKEADERDLGPTLVSARKWSEELGDLPQSATVLSGEALDEGGIRTVRDAALLVPNFTMTEFTARRLSFPFVRGIGSGQGEPSVATYVDGVPMLSTGSSNIPLVGLERVEFLRGPQGVLYGRNTIGGMLQLVSAQPTPTARLDAGVTFGNYDLREFELSYSGGLGIDPLLVGLDAFQSSRDGYTTNEFTGNRVDSRDAFFGRAQILFQPSDSSQLRFGVHGERARDGGFALNELQSLRAEPHTLNQDFEGVTERDVILPSMTFETFGDSIDFTSITSYTDWDVLETSDFDFSPIDGVQRSTQEAQEYFYQELRIASSEDADLMLGDDTELRWLLGVSGFLSDSEREESNDFRPGGAGIFFPPEAVGIDTRGGEFDDTAGAAFGQVTVTMDEKLELGAGVRYDHESKEADLSRTFETGGFPVLDETSSEERDFDEFLPRFSVGYHLDESSLVYALAAKGFKAGGFNLAAPAGEISFDEESSWTYELGFKRTWMDDLLQFGASVFLIDWNDMQLSLFDPFVGGFVTNAGESTSQGFEVELASAVTNDLDLFGSFGLTDTEFDEFVDPFGQDAAGNSLPFAPEETWAVGAQFERPIAESAAWFLRGEYAGVGTFYYDAGNRENESYQLVNLRGGIAFGRFRGELWVRNLFEEEYVPIAFQPSPADPTVFVGESGAPQTYGFTLRASF